jgi:hypothetical protein
MLVHIPPIEHVLGDVPRAQKVDVICDACPSIQVNPFLEEQISLLLVFLNVVGVSEIFGRAQLSCDSGQ